jgi:hypothetical protein
VYERQTCECTDINLLDVSRIKELLCSLFTKALFGLCQLNLIRDV